MRRAAVFACAALLAAAPAVAARPSFALRLAPDRFIPSELQVPSGTRIVLHVTNTGTVPAEFESADFQRERVIPAGGAITVYVGPLRPGAYVFFNDFKPSVRGRLVAK
ncbi:MAG: cupredoxin domain-containing protein [Rhodospirillales bacterium]|nr:cupredoxin domain-containing protein [Rhodospirillales bacterium]